MSIGACWIQCAGPDEDAHVSVSDKTVPVSVDALLQRLQTVRDFRAGGYEPAGSVAGRAQGLKRVQGSACKASVVGSGEMIFALMEQGDRLRGLRQHPDRQVFDSRPARRLCALYAAFGQFEAPRRCATPSR